MQAHHKADRYFQAAAGICGVALLFVGLMSTGWENINPGEFIIVVVTVGLSAFLPIRLFKTNLGLQHIFILGMALISDIVIIAWAAAIGVLAGTITFWLIREKRSWRRLLLPASWIKIGFSVSLVVVPSFLLIPLTNQVNGSGLQYLLPSLVYLLAHGALIVGRYLSQARPNDYSRFKKDLYQLICINLLSVTLLLIIFQISWELTFQYLILLSSLTLLFALLLDRLNAAHMERERRMQELATLNHISRTMRSTLDLEDLLPAIQQQVMQLLNVNNFYVALYNQEHEEIWYPFAVKFGENRSWPRRKISDRLTDRVIQEGKFILLTPQTQASSAPIGLPPSEDTPASWLGVPLIASERTIGCLAVFSVDPETTFTLSDADVLSILSGQVSVAIENALLYQQAQDHAQKLQTINQLTGAITASLDLDEVLTQVCASVAVVSGGERSAVFLLDAEGDHINLAYSHHLGDDFTERNASFSIAHSRRARCLRTGMPFIVQDLTNSSLSYDLIQLFQQDQIHAFADFPLITPDGQIGFLSVYYEHTHHFGVDEIDLLQTFASQAALAVSNARLHARTDAALARRVNQLATLEAVGRELSAASHTDQLFELILDYALEMTGSCCGSVGFIQAGTDQLEIKASYGYTLNHSDFPTSGGITNEAIKMGKIVNIGDVNNSPSYIKLGTENIQSQLSVPIIREEWLLGVISIESKEKNAYSKSEEGFVTQLATQAAIDIINAELYHETQRRLREQSALYQVSTRLVSAVNPLHVVQTIAQAFDAVLQPQATNIFYWDHEFDQFTRFNTIDSSRTSHISAADAANLLSDTTPDEHGWIFYSEEEPEFQLFADSVQGTQHIAIIPLEIADQILGLITLHLEVSKKISEDEHQLLKTIVAQGAIALQNAQLFSETSLGRERMTAILNSVEEGILMIDVNGRVLLSNEPTRSISGLPIEDYQGKPVTDLPRNFFETLEYTQDEIATLIEGINQSQAVISPKASFNIRDKNRTRVIERVTTPVWSYEGSVIGWMIVLRDVTEEHEINETREAITETIVHDLRSPMSAIVGALDLLSECLADPTEPIITQSLAVAQRSANRVLALTEALLDIARLQSGRMELDLTSVNLSPLVADLMEEFTVVANESGIIIHSEIPDQLAPLLADQEKLIRVLANLIDNSIKFTPEGGYVRITAEPAPNDMVAVKVTDSGPGVPADYREKIFERFIQVPGQRARRRGTGLGLAFCRLTVEAHQGRIWVDDNPTGGSIFTFTLPTETAVVTDEIRPSS